jgi:hypothetical protein
MEDYNSIIDGISNKITTRNVNEQKYHSFGFQRAGEAKGMPDAYDKTLHIVCEQARNEILESPVQGIRKDEAEAKLAQCNSEKEQRDNSIQVEKEKLKAEKDKLVDLQKELSTLKVKPNEILGNDLKGNSIHKIYFWIFLIITIFLSIYIFLFYNSAGYSALFKDFSADDTKISQAIFDPQALFNTFSEGIKGLMILFFFPFMFLGAGMSIHPLFSSEKKSIIRIILKIFAFALIVVSFIWDVILAYNITKKIDDIHIGGLVGEERANATRITLETAFTDVNFLTVIFSGFVAYMILSVVFYLCMDYRQKLNIVDNAKKAKKGEIEESKANCNSINVVIQNLETEQIKLSNQIKYYQDLIKGVVVKISDILPAINGFYTGWIAYMKNSNLSNDEIEKCTSYHNEFMNQLQINAGITNIKN